MKRRSREINVFSLSAIDLFACAMGAFLLLSLILFQYYLKAHNAPPAPPVDQTAKLEEQVAQYQASLDSAQTKILRLQEALEQTKEALENKKTEASRNRQLAFLGITTTAKSFVILLDMSKSMKDYEKIVQKTTDELLSQMDASYRIQIIGFQGHEGNTVPPTLTPWRQAGQTAPMNPENLSSAKRFLARAIKDFDGGTPTFMALHAALDYDTDAIFLLTDGEPTDVREWPEIVSQITRENAGKKKIYTIAIGNYRKNPKFVTFLESLSKENGGKFLGISD